MSPLRLQTLQRYPLSVILSYLTETEGTCVLITNKRLARSILPLFCLPCNGLNVVEARKRHKYVVYPAQDPLTLLDRLNTRRLRIRKRSHSHDMRCLNRGMTTTQLALLESKLSSASRYPADQELLRFLDTNETWFGTSLLASYPRSGNTLLRNLLERTTGVVTGSDNRPDRALSRALAVEHNLVGEGVTKQVHVVKTHFPERVGFRVEGHRVILLIRNPYDAIDSYWNLNLTNTHTKTVTDEVYHKYQDTYQAMARNEIKIWIDFHHYWLNVDLPVLVVRFEDLIVDMRSEMERIVKFVINEEQLSERWITRIQHACGLNGNTYALGSYKPRSATSGKASIGKALHKKRYTNELLQEFHAIARKSKQMQNGKTMLEYFGYDIENQGFPLNVFDWVPNKATPGSMKSMFVNEGAMIRPFTDPFGRAMKQWRQARTDMDRAPFPTVTS